MILQQQWVLPQLCIYNHEKFNLWDTFCDWPVAVDEHFNDSADVDVELTDKLTGTDTAVYIIMIKLNLRDRFYNSPMAVDDDWTDVDIELIAKNKMLISDNTHTYWPA